MTDLKIGKSVLRGIEGVIFDKDGTLIELEPYWLNVARIRSDVLNEYLRLDVDIGEVLYPLMGFDRRTGRMIKVPEISHEELLISLIKNLRSVYSVMITLKEVRECFQNANDIFNSEIDKYIFVKAGAKKLIKKLHRKGVKIGLVTSDSIGHATTMLHRNGLLQYFATLIGGNSIHGEKHTGKPCEEVLDRMGVDPKKCVTIGDMPIDIHMANMNNMLAGIGVYNGYTPLNKYTPYVVNSLREVHVKGF